MCSGKLLSRNLLWLVTLALAGAVGLLQLRSTTTDTAAGRDVAANVKSEFRVAAVDGVVLVARGKGWRGVRSRSGSSPWRPGCLRMRTAATDFAETLVERFVQALAFVRAVRQGRARTKKNVIPAGYQSGWAFDTLRDAYVQLLSAAGGSSTGGYVRDRTAAQGFGAAPFRWRRTSSRRGSSGVWRWRSTAFAIRIRPEEAPLYRQIIEKAVGTRDYGFAREILMTMLFSLAQSRRRVGQRGRGLGWSAALFTSQCWT
jgi:hypothetical protein